MKFPLKDTAFLKELDHYRNKIIYVRITSLTLDQFPIERIDGIATGGSVTIDGNSSVRRVCSLTMTTKELNINNIYWGITSRIKIEIGLVNQINPIYDDIIWFPMGVYILTDFKTSQQVNSYTITLNAKDKMCLLNGDVSGNFNAETDFKYEEIEQEDGTYKKYERSISYIVREMIHHYAQESYDNIIIKDIDSLAVEIIQNRTRKSIFLIQNLFSNEYAEVIVSGQDSVSSYYIPGSNIPIDFKTLESNQGFRFKTYINEDNTNLVNTKDDATMIWDANKVSYVVIKIENGQDMGYRLTEMYWPEKELIAAPNDTITSVLDKIIKTFGDYEYFYNLNGQFVFQAKQTYVNTSWNNVEDRRNEEGIDDDNGFYIKPQSVAQLVSYSFEGSSLITAYQNSPKIGNIKNDFTVWGKKHLESGVDLPIHMRYAIDIKPKFYAGFKQKVLDDNGNTVFEYHDVYVTPEFYQTMMAQTIAKADEEHLQAIKKAPPEYLKNTVNSEVEDPNAVWWTVLDWAEYYKSLVGDYPQGYLKNYGTEGYSGDIRFPDGNTRHFSSQLIFDVVRDTQVPYYGPVNLTGHSSSTRWSPFQHGFNGCYHTYNFFMQLDTTYSLDSWIYKPKIPSSLGNVAIYDELSYEEKFRIHQVDWREIIYQMALDYYKHNQEDSFYIDLHKNNYWPDFNIDLYINGKTGYEQYYHDLQGFWRQLYIPQNDRQTYFDSTRTLQVTQLNDDGEVIENSTYEFLRQSDGEYYLRDKNNYTGYIVSANDLTQKYLYSTLQNRDQLLSEKEQALAQKIEELNNVKAEIERLTNLEKEGNANNEVLTRITELNQQKALLKSERENLEVEVQEALDATYKNLTFKYLQSNPCEADFFEKLDFSSHSNLPDLNNCTELDYSIYGWWNKNVIEHPEDLIFWFDFFNAESIGISQFSVPAIGDRPKVVNNNSVHRIVNKDVPDLIYISLSDYEKYKNAYKLLTGYSYLYTTYLDDNKNEVNNILNDYIEDGLITRSARSITAQEEIDDLLYNYGYCNENITITSIPIYYLEPNTIISVKDEQRAVNGYYILNKMTIPLKYNGTMQSTATKVPERVY